MEIDIDLDSDVPIFTQLIEHIKQGVVSNQLPPGTALPSIRQIATDLDINNKTVAKAYRLLERDKIVQTKGYRGTYVHPDAKAHCHIKRDDWIEATLAEAVAKLRADGITDSEIRIAFQNILKRTTI